MKITKFQRDTDMKENSVLSLPSDNSKPLPRLTPAQFLPSAMLAWRRPLITITSVERELLVQARVQARPEDAKIPA
jgi:hypothetical protein